MEGRDPATPTGNHEPIWMETAEGTDYPALPGDRRVDVAVVGGGIAGLTTAFELDRAGRSVAVLERDRILTGTTGHTTAKVTSLHGLIYDHLVDHFGRERARQYARANQSAIDTVEETAARLDIDAEFRRAPAYTYVEPGSDRAAVHAEVEAARSLDLPVSYTEETDLPFEVGAAVRFDDQAYFHPRKYLLGLAEALVDGGGDIYEGTIVEDVVDGEPCRVETDRGDVVADHVVIASHFPVEDDAFYFARLSPKRSYIIAAELEGDAPEGMYYDPEEPYFSVRPHAGANSLVLVGGQNHRTGHSGSTAARYRRLERAARERFDVASIEYRWSTQDYVSVDRVPYVGRAAPQRTNVSLATGFGGWGMTNGTAAGTLLAGLVHGQEPPWADVFSPTRFEFSASKDDLVEHNKQSFGHYLDDYLGGPSGGDPADLDPGEGAVFGGRTDPVAVHRDTDGEFHAVSAVCSHMGCLVEWNDGERSWDCPCHGSRFDADGEVLDTPAVADLEAVDLPRRDAARPGRQEPGAE
jgi:glycine/D-amino acid oxidase-like deaminating enzyme/nitrite reductase/ring-hydroxylating ferredoxin subunit